MKRYYECVFTHNYDYFVKFHDGEVRKVPYNISVPSLYIKDNDENPKFRSMTDGAPLREIKLYTQAHIYKILNCRDDVVMKRYGLSKLPTHGNKNRTQCIIRENFPHQIGLNGEKVPESHMWALDIEVQRDERGYSSPSDAFQPILTIQVFDLRKNKGFILSTKECKEFKNEKWDLIVLHSERELLEKFCDILYRINPTYIFHFNGNFFDIPYITNRCKYYKIEQKLNVYGVKPSRGMTHDGIIYETYEWPSFVLLDVRELCKKYTFNQYPKMNLETVASILLGHGKINYDEYFDLQDLYEKDFRKFLEYGIRDVELLVEIERIYHFCMTARDMAFMCGVNPNEVGQTLFHWNSLVYNFALSKGLILPLNQEYTIHNACYSGGLCKGELGTYDYVYTFDVSSMYPNLIRTLSIGVDSLVKDIEEYEGYDEIKDLFWYYDTSKNPKFKELENLNDLEFKYIDELFKNKEKITKFLKKHDLCLAFNGLFYKRQSSVVEHLMGELYNARKANKAKMKDPNLTEKERDTLQVNEVRLKLAINSCYGSLSLGSNVFAFGAAQTASITSSGRALNRYVGHKISVMLNGSDDLGRMNAIPTVDTDAVYCVTGASSFEEADKILPKINEVIEKTVKEFEELLNVYQPGLLFYEQEEQLEKLITIAPKRYIGRKRKGGYKITGLEMKNKSTSSWAREKLMVIMDMIFDNVKHYEIAKYVRKLNDEFKTLPLNQICSIKSVNNLDYYKGRKNNDSSKMYRMNDEGKEIPAPINSRGSIVFNNYLINNKITNFEPIKEGDKVYMLYMTPTEPNGLRNKDLDGSNIICFKDPNSIEPLKHLIDWKTMFNKAFQDRLETITKPLHISLNPSAEIFEQWMNL